MLDATVGGKGQGKAGGSWRGDGMDTGEYPRASPLIL